MNIEFKKFSDYEKGILYKQLKNSYSFDQKWQEFFNDEWVKYDNFIYDNLVFTNNCGFVTVLDGKPIGHISWNPTTKPEYVEIGHNCILSEYKGNGYGQKQLREAVRLIKENYDVKKIIVTTNENLNPAQRNYENVGFKIKQKRENNESSFSGDYIDYELIL